jgi:hypothetical protein
MEKAPNLINHYFDMEAYSINPSVKYQIINSPELLSKEVSPSILESKNANLIDDGKWYVNWIKDNLGQDYHDEINNIVFNDSRLINLDINTKAVITMPVSALSDSFNIYRTLEMYNSQKCSSLFNIPIILWVNLLESTENSENNLSKIRTTLTEIERAKQDFKDVSIIDLYYLVPNEIVKNTNQTGGPWGSIVRRMYDIAAIASLNLANKSKERDPDILILRNDSDPIRLDDKYIESWASIANGKREIAYQGYSRFGSFDESSYPGLSLFMNFVKKHDEIMGHNNRFQAANFAFNASSYCQMAGMGIPYFTGIGSCDALLGERLKAVNEIKDPSLCDRDIIKFTEIELITDWSRPLAAYLNGVNPRNAWTTWSDNREGIKQRDADIVIEQDFAMETIDETISRLEIYINETLKSINDKKITEILIGFFERENYYYSKELFKFTDKGNEFICDFYESGLAYDEYIKKLEQ